MSMLGFIAQSFAMSGQVFLRTLPILVMLGILWAGLIFSVENIWVIGLLGFILGTYGTAFLFVTGLRAGLMTLKITTAPEAGALMNVTTRILFFHCLLFLLLGAILNVLLGIFGYFILFPTLAPDFAAYLTDAYLTGDPSVLETIHPNAAQSATLPFMLLTFASLAIMGGLFGVFGSPMAATAANAVRHSPQNDMIFGMGQYFFSQMVLYLITQAIPYVLILIFAPAGFLLGGTATLATSASLVISLLIYAVYSPAITWSGMALAYKLYREDLQEQRQAEIVPNIDYEAERDNLRALRTSRGGASRSTSVYDPHAQRKRYDDGDGGQ